MERHVSASLRHKSTNLKSQVCFTGQSGELLGGLSRIARNAQNSERYGAPSERDLRDWFLPDPKWLLQPGVVTQPNRQRVPSGRRFARGPPRENGKITAATIGVFGAGLGHCLGALQIAGFPAPYEFNRCVDEWCRAMRAVKPADPARSVTIPDGPSVRSKRSVGCAVFLSNRWLSPTCRRWRG